MLYLRKAGLIFLTSRKTAGTSFEIALSGFADADDIITPMGAEDEALRKANGGLSPRNYRFSLRDYARITIPELVKSLVHPTKHQKFYDHIPARDVRRRLGTNIFDDSMKIAIVRNPFDQLVSRYFWETRKKKKRPDFTSWVRANPYVINDNQVQYFIGETEIIDYYINFDTLSEDILNLEQLKPELTGLYDKFSNVRAKGNVRRSGQSTAQFFDREDELISAVRFFNRTIIERFDYDLSSVV